MGSQNAVMDASAVKCRASAIADKVDLIEARNLEVKEGSKVIVKDVDWHIRPGENWVLFGLNGCGKTTLLSRLCAYLSPSAGEVRLFGETVNEENQVRLRRRVGWVSGSFFDKYLRHEAVQEIVLAGKYGTLGFHDEWPDDADVRRAKRLLRSMGLAEKARYPYSTLSKGQQQKVLIARALMAEDLEVLVLDEPCSGLDIISRERFLHLVEGVVSQREFAVVYVTHHTEEILPFFNKAALMRDGGLYAMGDLKDVFCDDVLTGFFDTPAEVLWSRRHFFINLEVSEEASIEDVFI